MLSIGKLKAGQAKYYLDQAEARVDVVDSVADGMEDYYVGACEARGEWLGVAARELGLSGAVDADGLRRALAGLDPRDGSPLRDTASRVRVAGFDLTFSAPKSASVLFGIGDGAIRTAVRASHDRAVREAVGYLERNAAAVRRGRGGVIVEEATGFVAGAFRHRTSRAGDPQLHTHVLVANLGRGPDGRRSALDGRRLYAHARTASFIYQAVLRAELTRAVGVEWTPVRDGIGEVVGVPVSVRKALSRRRADIEAALESRGSSGPRAAEAAALATRGRKDKTMTADVLAQEWRSRASELGFGREELSRVVGWAPSRRAAGFDVESLWRDLAGPLGLTHRRATFSRRDAIQALCELLPVDGLNSSQALERAADAFLASPYVIALIPGDEGSGESFRRRDGRLMPASGEVVLYSTPEHLALEQRLVGRVVASRRTRAGVASERAVELAVARRPTLTEEQRSVVERLCLEGDRVAVIAGRAGSGKTFALGAAREAWQASGQAVLGVAVARRAAAELRDGAGIESTSVAALLQDVRLDSRRGLPAGAVLVVDEAGMVPTRDLAALLDHVEHVGGKLVLVGDHCQLPELEAGGTFRGLVRRELAIELRDNVRQVHRWERHALDELRDGRPDEALARYGAHGRISVNADQRQTRRALVGDWLAASGGQAVMIAHRRVDVAELNRLARERLRRGGRLGEVELSLPGGEFAVGDLVVVKRNDRRLGVHNGDRGRVTAVDRSAGALRVAIGDREAVLDGPFLAGATREGEPTVAHGYAITGHIAQGLTVDDAFVLADEGMNREWAYVAMSRGRQSNRLYLSERCDGARAEFAPTDQDKSDPIARLAASLRGSAAQVLAIDSGRPAAEPSAPGMLELQERVMDAERTRRALEAAGLRRLPGSLNRAVRAEAQARETLDQARRRSAERQHGARPFVDERGRSEQADLLERRAVRARERRRGIGREL